MPWRERCHRTMALWPYMIPLFTVYFAEYTLQVGCHGAASTCPVSSMLSLISPLNQVLLIVGRLVPLQTCDDQPCAAEAFIHSKSLCCLTRDLHVSGADGCMVCHRLSGGGRAGAQPLLQDSWLAISGGRLCVALFWPALPGVSGKRPARVPVILRQLRWIAY